MFRFTIRDMLWLTAAVGLAAGWYAHSLSWQHFYAGKVRQFDEGQAYCFRMVGEQMRLEIENSRLRDRLEELKETSTNNE